MSNETKTAAPSGELPALPEARAIRAGDASPKVYAMAYTADQMREYGELCRAAVSQAALEQATQAQIDGNSFQSRAEFVKWVELRHIDPAEDKDAWGGPRFVHSHVQAMWEGWVAFAQYGIPALAAPSGAPKQESEPLPIYLTFALSRALQASGWTYSGDDSASDSLHKASIEAGLFKHEHPKLDVPMSAECSAQLDELGDDRGQGLDGYWKWGFRAGWHYATLAAASTVQAQQAKIDALMLEHSPDEMTPEQVAEWGKHQQPASTVQSAPVLPETFQARVQPWLMECFGPVIAADHIERNHRFLEESLELVQSCGCTADEAHQLVEYVYGRPIGVVPQEVGGVMVTLAALCLAQGIDMHDAGETELARIWTKVEAIRAKQAAKPKHSPLPMAQSTPVQVEGQQGGEA